MEKKKKIISYENLEPGLQDALRKKYPSGYAAHVQKLQTPKETFTVVPLETKDALYMVKVKVTDKKSKSVDDEDDEFFEDDFSVPDTAASGFDTEKDEFADDEEDDNYGDKPEEGEEDEDDDEN